MESGRQKVTRKDVAREAGVSETIVSDTPASSATSFLVTFLRLLSTVLFLSGSFFFISSIHTSVCFFKDYTGIAACVILKSLILLRKLLPLHRKEHNYQLVFLHSHRSQQMISAAVHNSL